MYLIALCLPVTLFGQNLKPLTIGDKVPDVYLSHILNYEKSSGNLSEFMDKPLIIDFWFSECATCIEAMPHLDSLQKEYSEELNIILSTHQNERKIADFFENHSIGKKHKFINVVDDTTLRQLFPATGFPHQVWIDNDSVVIAITDGQSTTHENIEKILTGIPLNIAVKQDEMDPNVRNGANPLITYFDQQKSSILQYSFLGEYRQGFTGGARRETDTLNNITRLNIRNVDFLKLYDYAYHPPMGTAALHRSTRMAREDTNPIQTEADFVAKSNIFCYDIIYQGHLDLKKQSEIMIHDLDTYFNVKSVQEKKVMPCYIMKEVGSRRAYQEALHTDQNAFTENEKMVNGKNWIVNKGIIRFFLRDVNLYVDKPFIFEGDDSKNINFIVTWNPDDLASMNQQLQRFDLEIVIEEREREVIVLRNN